MKTHVRIYLDYFGYDESDFIPCEVCHAKAVDIHHIESRGMGGSKSKDVIENLQALCRSCHTCYGDRKQHLPMLISAHQTKLNLHNSQKITKLV